MSADGSRTAYQKWLGIQIDRGADGGARAEIPYDGKLTNPFGVVNRGVIASLIDLASGAALREAMGGEGRLATVDMDVRFLGPATADLVGEAHVVRAGGSIGVTRVDVSQRPPDGDTELVAIGSTTDRLFTGGG